MSDNLPFEVQVELMKRLPVKSLIQFRSVCKAWKSLIDSAHFIAHYSGQMQHLLVRYEELDVFEKKYVSVVVDDDDDDTFPKQIIYLTHPTVVNMLNFPDIAGSSHGLLCLHGYYGERHDLFEKRIAVLWNISIRKAVVVDVPNVGYRIDLGFGVCGETTDPKIVKITHTINMGNDTESLSCVPWDVEVFTLSTGAWRTPYSTNLPRKPIQSGYGQGVDGFYYWFAVDMSTIDGGIESYSLISFDMTSEEFGEVNLPDALAHRSVLDLSMSKLRESLVVLRHEERESVCHVWMMQDGVSKSFIKLFTISSPYATILRVHGFTKSGEPVIEIADNDSDPRDVSSSLAVYERHSKNITHLGINGKCSFLMDSYKESLLLLDQPEFVI